MAIFPNPIAPQPTQQGGLFTSAFARGVDQTQAMVYRFIQNIGEQTGVDILREWGEEGVIRNLEEAAQNPPRIESWDDVDSLSAFGEKVIETLGEQGANLLVTIASAAGLAALAVKAAPAAAAGMGAAAASTQVKALLGKAVLQKLPVAAGQNFIKKHAATVGASLGAFGSSTVVNTGETGLSFDEAGVHDPGGVLKTGMMKGALDALPVGYLASVARRTGIAPTQLVRAAQTVLGTTVAAGTLEGATEGLQTFLDHVALNARVPDYDLFSPDNLKEIREAMISGAVVGTTVGGAATTYARTRDYRAHKARVEADLQQQAIEALDPRQTDKPTVEFANEPERFVENEDAYGRLPPPTEERAYPYDPPPEVVNWAIDSATKMGVPDPIWWVKQEVSSLRQTLRSDVGRTDPITGEMLTGDQLSQLVQNEREFSARRYPEHAQQTYWEHEADTARFLEGKTPEYAEGLSYLRRILAGEISSPEAPGGQTTPVLHDPVSVISPVTADAPPRIPDTPIRESQQVIDAQVAAMLDPESSKDTVYLPPGSPQPSLDLTTTPQVIQQDLGPRGTVLTTSTQVADMLAQSGSPVEQMLGQALYGLPEGKPQVGDPREAAVVIARNAEGIPVSEAVVTDDTFDAAYDTAESIAGPTGSVDVRQMQFTIGERLARLAAEDPRGGYAYSEEDTKKVTDFFSQLPLASQRAVQSEIARDPRRARQIGEELLEMSRLPPDQQQMIISKLQEHFDRDVERQQALYDANPDEFFAAVDSEEVQGPATRESRDEREVMDERMGQQIDAAEPHRFFPPGLNRQGKYYASREMAQRELNKAQEANKDPNIELDLVPIYPQKTAAELADPLSSIRERTTRWGVQVTEKPAGFRPQETVEPRRIPRSQMTKGAKSLGETSFIYDALQHAVRKGKSRISWLARLNSERTAEDALLANDPNFRERARNSIVAVKDPDGVTRDVTLADLTDAGMSLLRSRKVAGETDSMEFALQGLETMIGEMTQLGWDTSAFMQKVRGPGAQVSVLRPNLHVRTGNLKDRKGRDVNVAEALMVREGKVREDIEQNRIYRRIAALEQDLEEAKRISDKDLIKDIRGELRPLYAARKPDFGTMVREDQVGTERDARENATQKLGKTEQFLDILETNLQRAIVNRDKAEAAGRKREWHDNQVEDLTQDIADTKQYIQHLERVLSDRRRVDDTAGMVDVASQRAEAEARIRDRQGDLTDEQQTNLLGEGPRGPLLGQTTRYGMAAEVKVRNQEVTLSEKQVSSPVGAPTTMPIDAAAVGIKEKSPLIEPMDRNRREHADPTGEAISYTEVASEEPRKARLRDARQTLEENETRSTPRTNLARQHSYRQGNVRGFGKSITQNDVDFISELLNEIGIDAPIMLLDVDMLNTDAATLIPLGRKLDEARAKFANDPTLRGTTIRTAAGPVIIIRGFSKENPTPRDRAMRLLALGHETGHNVLLAAIKNLTPQQRERLNRAFELEKKRTSTKAWEGNDGFKEWFSDKVAARARSLMEKPKGLNDAIFRQVAQRLKKLWNALKGKIPERFHANKQFNAVIDEMIMADAFDSSVLLNVIDDQFSDMHFPAPVTINQTLSGANLRTLRNAGRWFLNRGVINNAVGRIIFTTDGALRAISPTLADMLYTRSRTGSGKTSWTTDFTAAQERWNGELKHILKPYMDDQKTLDQAFYELAQELPTAELTSQLAKDLRRFMGRMFRYVNHPGGPGLKMEGHYFPRAYNKLEIQARGKEFVDILKKYGIVDPVDMYNTFVGEQETFNTSLAVMREGWQKSRKLHDPELIKELVNAGFLNTHPQDALWSYIHDVTRRVEYERRFGAWAYDEQTGEQTWDPNAKIEQEIRMIPNERERIVARNLVESTVFPRHIDPSNRLHNIIGELKAFEAFRVLLGSGLASIPEVAAVYSRANGEIGINEVVREMGKLLHDWESASDFAKAIDVVRKQIGSSAATTIYTDPSIGQRGFFRKALPHLFKWNGNDFVTNFSRALGANIGKTFILQQAQKIQDGTGNVAQAKRFLKELGIEDHEAVLRWEAAGAQPWRSTMAQGEQSDAEIVQKGISRYVHESVVNPNASERPSWASHPVGGLFWHLKTFSVSFNKQIISGVGREFENRLDEGGLTAASAYALGPALVFFTYATLLGALADELRQRIFTLGERGTWQASRRDPEKMLMRWFDRAGFDSLPYVDAVADPSVKNVAYALGPAASHAHQLFTELFLKGVVEGNERAATRAVLHSVPGVSQFPTVRREIYGMLQ